MNSDTPTTQPQDSSTPALDAFIATLEKDGGLDTWSGRRLKKLAEAVKEDLRNVR